MEEKIKSEIEELFENAPDTEEAMELQEEMISNAVEKYQDLIQRGFTEEQSYTMVMTSIGDVEELLAALGAQNSDGSARSEYWEKQAEYWKWQGEYLEKHAKKFGKQAKNALDSFLGSEIWESVSGSIRQVISSVGIKTQQDNGEYTAMDLYNVRKLSESGVASLVVELLGSSVDIEVSLSTGSDIVVQEYYNKVPEKEHLLEYTLSGDKVKIKYGSAAAGLPRKGLVKMALPESLAGSLEEFRIATASGDIALEDMGAKKQVYSAMSGDIKGKCSVGEVQVSTASGNVDFDVIHGKYTIRTASGDVRVGEADQEGSIDTASGDLTMDKVTGKITVHTASGDVYVDYLAGEGKFNTASGDIKLETVETDQAITCGTGSGDVDIQLAAQTSVQMNLKTGSGDINTFCDHLSAEEMVEYVKHGKYAVGTVGAEPFLTLNVTTGSGDIAVERMSAEEE